MNVQSGIPLLNWTCFYQEKGMEELKQCLLLTTMELENTRFKAEEELKLKDMQIIQLRYLLEKALQDKNEAQEKCQTIILENMFLHQQQQQQKQQSLARLSRNASSEEEPRKGIEVSSSDGDESIVSSPRLPAPPVAAPPEDKEFELIQNRALPEQGKLLEAVMKAGPLLQTLMLAGPLPEWRQPPPPLDTSQIPPPPLTISPSSTNFINNCGSSLSKKRSLNEGSDTSPTESKYQRLIIP